MTVFTVEQEIAHIEVGRPHVMLLGAGASRAALPDGDRDGQRLPVMADFSEVVPVAPVLDRSGMEWRNRNFEEVYSEISSTDSQRELREELESVIYDYFSSLALPSEPTTYDLLLLSLRAKDVLVTFNWDPFIVQALERTRHIRRELKHPFIVFLHGNVGSAFCATDNLHGRVGGTCSSCGQPFQPSRLLYPVVEKDYERDPQIADAWRFIAQALERAFMVTVFGYGAPSSDVAAMDLLRAAWGPKENRELEQFEVIDIKPEDELLATWQDFILSHHYEVHGDIADSWVLKHPRRSGDAYWNQYMNAYFIENNPVPRSPSWPELEQWFAPLLEHERRAV